MKRALGLVSVIAVGWVSSARAAPLADSHTLFLNDCQPNGCAVHRGLTSNAATDTSAVLSANGTVAAFNQGATVWGSVLSCMKTVMSPFDLTVTDQRPASGPYFEVIVAGTSTDVGEPSDLGALGESSCSAVGQCSTPYVSKEVAFAFANSSFYANAPNEICAGAAQAIALSWTLDHVVDASDVMTFNAYTGVPAFHDDEACGSDCVGGTSPFGSTCTGSGGQATHTCFGSGKATQDEVQTLLALFGPAPTLPDGGVDGSFDGGGDGAVDGVQSEGGVDGAGGGGSADASSGSSMGGSGGADAATTAADGGRDTGTAGASGACSVNADCAVGHYCDATAKMCTFDCRVAADCATGNTCNSLGMCVAKATSSGGGCSCRVDGGPGGGVASGVVFLMTFAALRRRSSRRRRT